MPELKWYKIYYGLGGSFGGEQYGYTAQFGNEEEANKAAWESACEKFESYAGMYGLRTLEDIMEQDGLDEEEAANVYNEERENWLEYHAEEATGPDDEGESDEVSE